MNPVNLTEPRQGKHKRPMDGKRLCPVVGMVMLGAGLVGGCVQVNAPDEPIVIELNINITQEVIYRLAADAGNTIEENADIF